MRVRQRETEIDPVEPARSLLRCSYCGNNNKRGSNYLCKKSEGPNKKLTPFFQALPPVVARADFAFQMRKRQREREKEGEREEESEN